MTDAPDPGLTDLIAAHVLSGPYIEYDSDGHHADDFYRCGENCKWTSNEGTVNRSAFAAHAAHVALVVEQHTNGRITELAANIQHLSNNLDVARMGRATAEATIARVEKALAEGPLHRIDFPRSKGPYGIERQTIRAALEEEQQ